MSFDRKWGENAHSGGSSDDWGSPLNTVWESIPRVWIYTAVWEVEARMAPSFEIAREITGDVWMSIILTIV